MKAKKELLNYLIFGALTTLINIVSYTFFTKLLNTDFKTATTIAWILSVLFAFVTNKLYVFHSTGKNIFTISKELGSFLLSRLLSYGLDILSMILLVQILVINDLIAKVIANILVVIFNYLASKLFVFKQLASGDNK
jgi:putative flippase GtrA